MNKHLTIRKMNKHLTIVVVTSLLLLASLNLAQAMVQFLASSAAAKIIRQRGLKPVAKSRRFGLHKELWNVTLIAENFFAKA